MQKFIKNTLLQYIPDELNVEEIVKSERACIYKEHEIKGNNVVYLCERELRAKDNFALQFAIKKADELRIPLKIVSPAINAERKQKQYFLNKQLEKIENAFLTNGFDFEINDNIKNYLENIYPAILIVDFNPILNRNWIKELNCTIYEIDSHNIVPARYVSDKQEYSAATLRRKIYHNIALFLNEYDNAICYKSEADYVLKDFIENKLPDYSEFRNNPNKDVLSGLSKYLNLGFISSQRVAIEVLKSNVSDINKETFLEELIIRKELADNFCLYCEKYKTLDCINNWAKNSLEEHKNDLRPYCYSFQELETAKTHDDLWNASQRQLLKEGCIHSYLRMYWAKKIFEWTLSPNQALEYAICLNDKYAYDAPSSSGYVNILWSIAGLHDRAFADYPVTGKIRRMTYNSLKSKFDIKGYIDKFR